MYHIADGPSEALAVLVALALGRAGVEHERTCPSKEHAGCGQAEKAEFEREGIHSLICVAMIHAGVVGGFLGLDSVRVQRNWSEDEISLLRVMGEILMGAIVRQRAEQALQESERKYKTLVETTATGFVILDEGGRVLDANAEYVRMSGHRTLEEIRGRAVVEWTAVHDRVRNAEAVVDCMRCGFAREGRKSGV